MERRTEALQRRRLVKKQMDRMKSLIRRLYKFLMRSRRHKRVTKGFLGGPRVGTYSIHPPSGVTWPQKRQGCGKKIKKIHPPTNPYLYTHMYRLAIYFIFMKYQCTYSHTRKSILFQMLLSRKIHI